MTKEEVKELLRRYSSGTCTEEEKALLESWYLQFKGGDFDFGAEELELIKKESWRNVVSRNKRERHVFSRFQYAAAAVVFVFFSIGLFLYFNQGFDRKQLSDQENIAKNDLMPGGNKATLTLADGSVVSLDDSSNGIIAQVEGVSISKTSDGQVIYNIADNSSLKEGAILKYNQISTPRGGQYQVVLPDGTKVWLNAQSSLKYPTLFAGKERKVELDGEAYFEVAKDADRPFKVGVNGDMEVLVLGTHFNVSAYEGDNTVNTTLVEGAVRVNAGGLVEQIVPGQQVQFNKKYNQLNLIKDVNVRQVVSWKNGFFSYDIISLEELMKEVERWYDVDVVYKNNIQAEFVAKLPKNVSLQELLKLLELTKQVHFKLDKKTLTVMK